MSSRILSTLFLFLVVWSPQLRAQDEILYHDAAGQKDVGLKGTLVEESPERVVFRTSANAPPREVSAREIREVIYEVPGGVKLDYNKARNDERRGQDAGLREEERLQALADAYKGYQTVLPRLTGPRYRPAARHMHYKSARLLTRLAEEQPRNRDAALEALERFLKDDGDGWQLVRAARMLLRLYKDKDDLTNVLKVCDSLVARVELPAEMRQEFAFLAVDALLAGRKTKDAAARLKVLGQAAMGKGQTYQLLCDAQAGQAAGVKTKLEKLIADTAEPRLKAAAYNALGDCLRWSNQKQEALWAYLWVDVVYMQDASELSRAQEQLVKLFQERGDDARALAYRQRLRAAE